MVSVAELDALLRRGPEPPRCSTSAGSSAAGPRPRPLLRRPHSRRRVRRPRRRSGRRRRGRAGAIRSRAAGFRGRHARGRGEHGPWGGRLRRRDSTGRGAGLVAAALLRPPRGRGARRRARRLAPAQGWPARAGSHCGHARRRLRGAARGDGGARRRAAPQRWRPRRAARCARARALPGRDRAHRSRGRPHPGGAQPARPTLNVDALGRFLAPSALRQAFAPPASSTRRGRGLLRLGGHRRPRGAGARAGRLPRGAVPGVVERVDPIRRRARPVATGCGRATRGTLSTPSAQSCLAAARIRHDDQLS